MNESDTVKYVGQAFAKYITRAGSEGFRPITKKREKQGIIMRIIMSIIVAAMVFTAMSLQAPPAYAEEENSASASVSAMSLYMWRGVRLSESMVLQPSVDFVRGSFGANIWTNIDMDPDPRVWPDDNAVLTETDITLSYSLPFKRARGLLAYKTTNKKGNPEKGSL